MEHANHALMASNGKRKRPDESAPSSSGKISRTGEQYGCSLELLPEEMMVSIFNLLSNKDLLACRAVCKRFVLVIGESVLLDKAKAFWKQFSQPPDPALFGRDRYKLVLRPWFEAYATAQQRLPDGASGNLQFSDSKREEDERQASSEQTEQVQAIKSSQVKQLDRLIEHEEFPKALFLIQTKTFQHAKSLYLQEKLSHSCTEIVETVCFSPDGRSLLIAFDYTVRFMVLDENRNVIRKYSKDYNLPVEGLCFSPDGHSLLIGFNHSIMIMGLAGKDWAQKGETVIRPDYSQAKVCFSSDSGSLAAVLRGSIRIMSRDEKSNWVQSSEIPVSDARAVCFNPNGSSLAVSSRYVVWIMVRDEKGNRVQNSRIPFSTFTLVQSVCFSPDGDSLAISCGKNSGRPGFVLIMRSDGKDNWVKNFVIPYEYSCSARFSPDGHNLILQTIDCGIQRCQVIGLDRANGRVCKYDHFLLLHRREDGDGACISPDGGSLAIIGLDGTTRIMGLDEGKWFEKACIPNEGHVSKLCFSPDGRRLAIILRLFGYASWVSQIKIYEIKTGAKVLTDRDNRFLKGFFSS